MYFEGLPWRALMPALRGEASCTHSAPHSAAAALGAIAPPGEALVVRPLVLGKGQMGLALMGSLHLFMFFDRNFVGSPVNLL